MAFEVILLISEDIAAGVELKLQTRETEARAITTAITRALLCSKLIF